MKFGKEVRTPEFKIMKLIKFKEQKDLIERGSCLNKEEENNGAWEEIGREAWCKECIENSSLASEGEKS